MSSLLSLPPFFLSSLLSLPPCYNSAPLVSFRTDGVVRKRMQLFFMCVKLATLRGTVRGRRRACLHERLLVSWERSCPGKHTLLGLSQHQQTAALLYSLCMQFFLSRIKDYHSADLLEIQLPPTFHFRHRLQHITGTQSTRRESTFRFNPAELTQRTGYTCFVKAGWSGSVIASSNSV